MNFSTDLADEREKILACGQLNGIERSERDEGDVHISEIQVCTQAAAEKIGKPQGKYITVTLPPFESCSELFGGRLNAVRDSLKSMLPGEGRVLVAGLGNRFITSDALGPKCADMIFATNHLPADFAKSAGLPELRAVAALSPGVAGQTGIEAAELIKGAVERISPCAVITVDALAARELSRLGCTVQLTDTGIAPGSGVGNSRARLDSETLGVPVIAVGVPTVIGVLAAAADIAEKEDIDLFSESIRKRYEGMSVTVREADNMISRASKLVALAVNCALQPTLSERDISEIMQ